MFLEKVFLFFDVEYFLNKSSPIYGTPSILRIDDERKYLMFLNYHYKTSKNVQLEDSCMILIIDKQG